MAESVKESDPLKPLLVSIRYLGVVPADPVMRAIDHGLLSITLSIVAEPLEGSNFAGPVT